jgi:hypothetical protein
MSKTSVSAVLSSALLAIDDAIDNASTANDNTDLMSSTSMPVQSNIARDVIKRASDFKKFEEAVFEGVANAYEAYDFGETPVVTITARSIGKNWKLVIEDNGIGMDALVGLPNFFSMHLKTVRRANGLNMRGYNGTGKIACFKYARRMEVSSVKDGLRNVLVLTLDELNDAAKENRQPQVQWLVKNHPTDDHSGTTISISDFREGYDLSAASQIILKRKLGMEQMMWMKQAVINFNGEVVEPWAVPADDTHTAVSECGNFSLEISYKKDGYGDMVELPYVYISAGRVFVARELYGMEGHKYANHVHVDVKASEQWAEKHFYDRREDFVSEARDLKLKVTHPQAVALRNFTTSAVASYMSKLVADEEKRRKESMDDAKRKIEREFSSIFSNVKQLMGTLGGGFAQGSTGTGGDSKPRLRVVQEGEVQKRERNETTKQKNAVSIVFGVLSEDKEFQVTITDQEHSIILNEEYRTVKSVASATDSIVYRLATLDMCKNAFIDLMITLHTQASYAEGLPAPEQFLREIRDTSAKVRNKVAETTVPYYEACLRAMTA